jgi:flagellar hook-associated protein 1 FlgK
MGSLSASLSIALQSMLAEQGAIEATSNNIANVNTPGYSRQRPDLAETTPIQVGGLSFGTGVQLTDVTSLRDKVLDLRINQETQQQGQLNTFISNGQQIQVLFNETAGTGLQAPLTAFFNSLSELSTNPSDLTARQNVLTAAQNLASTFNQTAGHLSILQRNTDLAVQQSVTQINSLTAQIAQVNEQVGAASTTGANAGPFEDQRQQLINQLSNYIDVSEVDAGNNSLTLTTTSGSALVVGGQSFQLTTQANSSNGFQDVYANGVDVTSQIMSGALAGQIQIRDKEIPAMQNSLNTLAYSLATNINQINRQGVDLNGVAGGDLFKIPAQVTGSAASIGLATTDPTKIAAASAGPPAGGPGDNTNANAMLALQNQTIVNGLTPMNYYSNLVFQVGNDISSAQTEQSAGSQVLLQLQNLQGGVSGVDINEEAANLMRFQNAYQASAQISSVIGHLMDVTMNMVSGT